MPAARASHSLPGSKRILTVDDNPDLRRLVAHHLGRAGFAVLEAGDGQQAVRLLQTTVPDLILLDIRMPEMHGLQLLERLREHPPAAAIPVVMLTVLSHPDIVDRALRLGVVDYLVKPLEPAVLIAHVNAALAQHPAPARHTAPGAHWSGANRRLFVRGSILDLDLTPLPAGKGIDISEGGIGWRTRHPPARDAIVVIEAPILFAELNIHDRSLRARVVHIRKLSLGHHRVAARFVGLTAATRHALRAYARDRPTGSALT